MLRLLRMTEPAWARERLAELPALLLDQAHLEKKAASSAMTLMFRYPQHACLQKPLSELAREELSHFEAVLDLMAERGLAYGKFRPGPYMAAMVRGVRDEEPQRLLDQLLCSALIEARSCERMKVLSIALQGHDAELGAFYHDLVVSEARHHQLFVELAKQLFPAREVELRLGELLSHEEQVLRESACPGRLHG